MKVILDKTKEVHDKQKQKLARSLKEAFNMSNYTKPKERFKNGQATLK